KAGKQCAVILLDGNAAGPGGSEDAAVIGGGIPIHGDAVEGAVNGTGEHRLQQVLRNCRIGEHIAKHGGHVRLDHAGALGKPGNGDLAVATVNLDRTGLGTGVGGHDATGGVQPVVAE